jgi:hypothetical protein
MRLPLEETGDNLRLDEVLVISCSKAQKTRAFSDLASLWAEKTYVLI